MAEKNVILKNSIGDVLYPKIADNSVTTNKIVDKAVTTNKIDNNAITEDKIASSAVTTSKIADGSISKEKLDPEVLSSKADNGIMIDIVNTGTEDAGIPVWKAVYDISNTDIEDAFGKVPVNFVIKDDYDYDQGSGELKYHLIPVYYMYFQNNSSSIDLKAESKEYVIQVHPTASSDYSKFGNITQYRWYVSKNRVYTDDIADNAVTVDKLADNVLEDVTSITWDELKTLRDSSKLIPGHQYRITDYQCTTTQENTQSAGHQFDIIVTADSTNKLNEKARACLHDGDTYFKNSNLAAWQLWYSLDNDANRFAWADTHILVQAYRCPNASVNLSATSTTVINGVTYYYWYDAGYSYMSSKNPAALKAGDNIYYSITAGLTVPTFVYTDQTSIIHITRPTGVIYRMIDEWNNDCPYDFKNILFKRYKITSSNSSSLEGTYLATKAISDIGLEIDNNDSKMFYTFSYLGKLNTQADYNGGTLEDASVIGNTLQSDDSSPYGVHGNTIKYYFDIGIENSKPIQSLNNIVFLTYTGEAYYGCYSNSFGNNCTNNSFGNSCTNNSFSDDNQFIIFGDNCIENLFYNSCRKTIFGQRCCDNLINYCNAIVFGDNCNTNYFGQNCNDISFGNNCTNNSFGTGCDHITLGNYYRLNTFDNGVSYVTFDGDGTGSKPIQNYHVKHDIVFDFASKYTITAKPGLNYVLSVAKRSDGTVVEYNEADTHKLVSITDSDYATLTTKDSNTLYCIPE